METWIKSDNKWLKLGGLNASCDKLPPVNSDILIEQVLVFIGWYAAMKQWKYASQNLTLLQLIDTVERKSWLEITFVIWIYPNGKTDDFGYAPTIFLTTYSE